MPLVWRLTLSLAAVLALLGVGLGLSVYRAVELDLQRDFVRDLRALAYVQAQLALREDGVSLSRVPIAALGDELGEPEAFLLTPTGEVIETLSDAPPPRLSRAFLARAASGQTVDGLQGERRGGLSLFDPAPAVHTRLVAEPISAFSAGRFEVAYLLVLRARDEGTVAALGRVRREVLTWLAAGLALSVPIGYLLARVIAAPVSEMAQTARAVRGGDLRARVPERGRGDELGALGRDLNAMLERLEALVSAQRRFTADAAHDLRTPIAVLRGEVDLALRRPRSAEEYRDTLSRMRGDLAGLSTLAEDLLTLARLEGSAVGAPGEAAPVPASEVLERPLSTAHALARQRGRRLDTDLAPGVWVRGDPALLGRALLNLLTNALTHGGDARLRVRRSEGGNEVVFEVEDSGPGVPPELRGEALFTRFARGERSEGSGLGVAIAREVARVHGGHLSYRGPPDGPSTFTLRLPAAPVDVRGDL
ncbi:Signal transduction histidine kinase [Deinococcus reticulitermitis]|uniref:histidine kinase n=1 Tax=Deinococcus reticulitermitis TaxID=856736 RepID=A0A1H6XGD5_9DEIO|nr:HAMP domain-containing sensor histidine kinase [Deinococcus reticulitermitis]SEJ28153.1 Signal transduction histidine kinase [Deinococcus reticulitermitis]